MAKKLGYCWPCHEVGRDFVPGVVLLNGDPHCAACARQAGAPTDAVETPQIDFPVTRKAVPLVGSVCAQGCGKPRHKGRCGKAHHFATQPAVSAGKAEPIELPPAVIEIETVQAEPAKEPVSMDKLVSRAIRIADIPDAAKVTHRDVGRTGALWLALVASAGTDTPVQEVQNRDTTHCRHTDNDVARKAKKRGRVYHSKRDGSVLYCWLEAVQA